MKLKIALASGKMYVRNVKRENHMSKKTMKKNKHNPFANKVKNTQKFDIAEVNRVTGSYILLSNLGNTKNNYWNKKK